MVQLPGLNTPQFDWVRAKLARRPRPTGTIYQPELAARAIHFAAHARRKEVYVGRPAYEVIVADKLASPLLDRYLAATSIEGQQDVLPLEEERRDNLFEPVPGDRGAHGRFGDESRRSSLSLPATMHRNALLIAGIGLGGAALLALGRNHRASRPG
jgi:hypothetical protein